jgi:hypothetical protein
LLGYVENCIVCNVENKFKNFALIKNVNLLLGYMENCIVCNVENKFKNFALIKDLLQIDRLLHDLVVQQHPHSTHDQDKSLPAHHQSTKLGAENHMLLLKV